MRSRASVRLKVRSPDSCREHPRRPRRLCVPSFVADSEGQSGRDHTRLCPWVAFGRTDYAAVARAMGLRGAVATGPEALSAAYAEALAAPVPTVIAIEIPPGAYDGLI